MSQLAFGITVAMLTFWASGLFLGLQHVSERYTPVMMNVMLRRRICLLPLALLVACMVASGIFAVLPSSRLTDTVALIITVGSILIALIAVYRLIYALSNAALMVSWLRQQAVKGHKRHTGKEQYDDPLEEVLLGAIHRDDRRTAQELLRQILGTASEPTHERALLTWLEQRPELVAINLFSTELLDALLSSALSSTTAESRAKILQLLVSEALNTEAYSRGRAAVGAIMKALTQQIPWTRAYTYITESLGFALWRVGDEEAWSWRISNTPNQLRDVQDVFFAELKRAWRHIFPREDARATHTFTLAVIETLHYVDEHDESAVSWVLSIMYDILEDGYHHDLLARDTLLELGNALGRFDRALPQDSADLRAWIDDLTVTIAAIFMTILDRPDLTTGDDELSELVPSKTDNIAIITLGNDASNPTTTGEPEGLPEMPEQMAGTAQAFDTAQSMASESDEKEEAERMFRHLLMNSGLHRRVIQGKKLTPHIQAWLPRASYDAVARELGIPPFHDDEV